MTKAEKKKILAAKCEEIKVLIKAGWSPGYARGLVGVYQIQFQEMRKQDKELQDMCIEYNNRNLGKHDRVGVPTEVKWIPKAEVKEEPAAPTEPQDLILPIGLMR